MSRPPGAVFCMEREARYKWKHQMQSRAFDYWDVWVPRQTRVALTFRHLTADTRRAFTRISELTAGKFGAFSGSLLHAVCLQALEQTGGDDLATQYQKRHMSA